MYKDLKLTWCKTFKRRIYSISLCCIFFLSSCNCESPSKNDTNNLSVKPNEIILFWGNPGIGKSTLCNSIFQSHEFDSGISLGTGLTIRKQEHVYENRLYIDTPGLADVVKRKQAAEQIEEALKHNDGNYKILFVAFLDSGRIRPDDIASINVICDAITAKFEYGLIFNQVPKKILNQLQQKGLQNVYDYFTVLNKKPSLTLFLTEDENLSGEENKYFQGKDENREKLLKFLSQLNANKIESHEVKKIDIRDYNEKINEVELKYQKTLNELSKKEKGKN